MNDVLTVSEVAQYLRVNPQTVYRKAKVGQLPAVRIGRAIRFRRSELEIWMRAGFGKVVIPAEAGIQAERGSSLSRGPALDSIEG